MQPTKEGKISVSVMCSDLMNLERDIKQLERNGVDYLHVDVMDAHFVPNLTFGVDFIAAMHRVTKLPLDIHLMVEHPLPIMEAMDIRPGDRISLHVELGEQLHELAKAVRARGAHFGLVVNPSTPVSNTLTPFRRHRRSSTNGTAGSWHCCTSRHRCPFRNWPTCSASRR